VRPEPELVTIIRRLSDLEQQDELGLGEISELNALRLWLSVSAPEVGAELAHAYVAVAAGP